MPALGQIDTNKLYSDIINSNKSQLGNVPEKTSSVSPNRLGESPETSLYSQYGSESQTNLPSDLRKTFLASTVNLGNAVIETGRQTGIIPEDVATREQIKGAESAKRLTESTTPQFQREAAKQLITDEGDMGDFSGTTLLHRLTASAPDMIATIGPAAGATKVLQASKWAAKLGIGGGAAASATEGLIAGAENAHQARLEALNTPFETYRQNPLFNEEIAKLDPSLPIEQREEEARTILANKVGDDVFLKTAASTGLIGAVTGGGAIGNLLNKTGGKITQSYIKAVGKDAAQEAFQELGQSAGEHLISASAKKEFVDPNTDVTEGLLNAAAEGALVGGVMGGGIGAAGNIGSASLPSLPQRTEQKKGEVTNPNTGEKIQDSGVKGAYSKFEDVFTQTQSSADPNYQSTYDATVTNLQNIINEETNNHNDPEKTADEIRLKEAQDMLEIIQQSHTSLLNTERKAEEAKKAGEKVVEQGQEEAKKEADSSTTTQETPSTQEVPPTPEAPEEATGPSPEELRGLMEDSGFVQEEEVTQEAPTVPEVPVETQEPTATEVPAAPIEPSAPEGKVSPIIKNVIGNLKDDELLPQLNAMLANYKNRAFDKDGTVIDVNAKATVDFLETKIKEVIPAAQPVQEIPVVPPVQERVVRQSAPKKSTSISTNVIPKKELIDQIESKGFRQVPIDINQTIFRTKSRVETANEKIRDIQRELEDTSGELANLEGLKNLRATKLRKELSGDIVRLRNELENYNSIIPELTSRDERDSRESSTRGFAKSVRDELNSSISSGEISPSEVKEIVTEASNIPDVIEASNYIQNKIDEKNLQYLIQSKMDKLKAISEVKKADGKIDWDTMWEQGTPVRHLKEAAKEITDLQAKLADTTKELKSANKKQKTTKADVSSGTQPQVRQESGNQTVSSEGVRKGRQETRKAKKFERGQRLVVDATQLFDRELPSILSSKLTKEQLANLEIEVVRDTRNLVEAIASYPQANGKPGFVRAMFDKRAIKDLENIQTVPPKPKVPEDFVESTDTTLEKSFDNQVIALSNQLSKVINNDEFLNQVGASGATSLGAVNESNAKRDFIEAVASEKVLDIITSAIAPDFITASDSSKQLIRRYTQLSNKYLRQRRIVERDYGDKGWLNWLDTKLLIEANRIGNSLDIIEEVSQEKEVSIEKSEDIILADDSSTSPDIIIREETVKKNKSPRKVKVKKTKPKIEDSYEYDDLNEDESFTHNLDLINSVTQGIEVPDTPEVKLTAKAEVTLAALQENLDSLNEEIEQAKIDEDEDHLAELRDEKKKLLKKMDKARGIKPTKNKQATVESKRSITEIDEDGQEELFALPAWVTTPVESQIDHKANSEVFDRIKKGIKQSKLLEGLTIEYIEDFSKHDWTPTPINPSQNLFFAHGVHKSIGSETFIYINGSRFGNTKDMVATVFHELVGHFGVRKLFDKADGTNEYDNFLEALLAGDLKADIFANAGAWSSYLTDWKRVNVTGYISTLKTDGKEAAEKLYQDRVDRLPPEQRITINKIVNGKVVRLNFPKSIALRYADEYVAEVAAAKLMDDSFVENEIGLGTPSDISRTNARLKRSKLLERVYKKVIHFLKKIFGSTFDQLTKEDVVTAIAESYDQIFNEVNTTTKLISTKPFNRVVSTQYQGEDKYPSRPKLTLAPKGPVSEDLSYNLGNNTRFFNSGGVLRDPSTKKELATISFRDITEDDDLFEEVGNNAIMISYIDSKDRGLGYGSKILEDMISKANFEGKKLVLIPAATPDRLLGGLTQEALKSWYKRHGFVDLIDYMFKEPSGIGTESFSLPPQTNVAGYTYTPFSFVTDERAFSNSFLSDLGNHSETVRGKYLDKFENAVRNNKVLSTFTTFGNMQNRDLYRSLQAIGKGHVAKVEAATTSFAAALKGLTPLQNKIVFDYFTTKNADPAELPVTPIQRAAIVKAKEAIRNTGKFLADAGIIPKESFEANEDAYLHIQYLKFIDQYRGSGKKPSAFSFAKQRKSRSELEALALGQIKDVAFLVPETYGVMARDLVLVEMFNSINKMSNINKLHWVLTGNTQVRYGRQRLSIDKAREQVEQNLFILNELDRADRRNYFQAGQIEEEQFKLQTIKLQEDLDKIEQKFIDEAYQHAVQTGQSTAISKENFLEQHYVKMPDKKQLGQLRNKYVRKEIANDLEVFTNNWNTAHKNNIEKFFAPGGTLERINRFWKLSMVGLNPASWVRNFFGNFALLDLSTSTNKGKLMGMLVEEIHGSMKNPSKWWKLSDQYGLFGTTLSAVELQDIYNQYGSELEAAQASYNSSSRSGWDNALVFTDERLVPLMKMIHGKTTTQTNKMFAWLEGSFKTVSFRDYVQTWEKEQGRSIDDLTDSEREVVYSKAANHANQSLFDYSQVPGWVSTLRRVPFGAPFLTFTYKAGPAAIRAMVRQPIKFAEYATLPFLLTTIAMASNDWDDDDIRRMKQALPDYYRLNSGTAFLPFKDSAGRPQILPLDYMIPWSQYVTAARHVHDNFVEDHGESPITTSLQSIGTVFKEFGFLGGPTPTAVAAMLNGKDSFSGRSIVTPGASGSQQLGEIMTFAGNMMVPSWLSSHGWASKMYDAFIGELPKDRFGDVKFTPGQAVAGITGFGAIGVSEQSGTFNRRQHFTKQIQEVTNLRNKIARDHNLDFEEKASKIKDANQRIKLIRLQMQEDLG